jgi:hypothetical protein
LITIKVSFAVCGGFIFAWFPYACFSLWSAFGDTSAIPIWLTPLPVILAKTSIAYNPLIYVTLTDRYRYLCDHWNPLFIFLVFALLPEAPSPLTGVLHFVHWVGRCDADRFVESPAHFLSALIQPSSIYRSPQNQSWPDNCEPRRSSLGFVPKNNSCN